MSSALLTKRWHSLERDTVRRLQGEKLHCYLRDCVLPFSKHYQKVFAAHGLTAADFRSIDDLRQLPFTRKEDLLPTPDNPRKSLEFALIPDPKVQARRPSVFLRSLWRGQIGRASCRERV